MSLHGFFTARELLRQDVPFYALIMAAMAKADPNNLRKLRDAWPEVWAELEERCNSPGGMTAAELAERRPELERKP